MDYSPNVCNILSTHKPHCTQCNGPVKIWIYGREEKPVVTVGVCKNGCWDAEPCDGGMLSMLGEGRTLTQRELGTFHRELSLESSAKADRCLHDPGCNAKAILAHSIPKSWLTNLGGNKVYLFRFPPHALRPTGHSHEVPHLVSRKKATTSRFCCSEHDKIFNPVDSRSSDFNGQHNLNLLFYRALLCRLHSVLAAKELFDTHIGHNASLENPQPNLSIEKQIPLLTLACSLLRVALSRPILNWRIRHITRFIGGRPAIACSNAGDWVSNYVDIRSTSRPRPVRALGAWGITVVPKKAGHVIAYHYCSLERNVSLAREHLGKMASELSFLSELGNDNLAVEVSKHLIALTEDLCISSQVWESFSEEKRSLINKAWFANLFVDDDEFANLSLDGVPSGEDKILNLLA